LSKLPQECGTVLAAGGFEPPIPGNADSARTSTQGFSQQGDWASAT